MGITIMIIAHFIYIGGFHISIEKLLTQADKKDNSSSTCKLHPMTYMWRVAGNREIQGNLFKSIQSTAI